MIKEPMDPIQKDSSEKRTYKVGTLEYTKMGLVMVFFWMLWGDFCLNIMERVVPSILPLEIHRLQGNDKLLSLVMITIPAAFNMIICPWVSFKSDRHRSKRGRRIPFLLFPTPWISAILILLGFSYDIGGFLHRTILSGTSLSVNLVILGVMAVLATTFNFFNMFVQSVYYYLFNDVIPEEYLGRFMAMFRLVGTGAGAAFSYFIFRYIESEMKLVFIGAGILYFTAFMLMCWRVKEGEYPPPPENLDKKTSTLSSLKTYFIESFSHPFYRYFFMATTAGDLTTGGCIGQWGLLYTHTSLGIDLFRLGKMNALASLIGVFLLYPMGMLADKKHPLRVTLWGVGLIMCLMPIQFVYLFYNFTPGQAYKILFTYTMIILPVSLMTGAAGMPMYMRLLPKEKYGQFCSAQAMFRSACVMVFGFLSGEIFDVLRGVVLHHGMPESFVYRFIPVIQWLCMTAQFILLLVVLKYFKKLGGYENYKAPEPLSAKKMEQVAS